MSSQRDRAIELLRRFLRRKDDTAVLAQFRDALTREILLTERLRVKAVIITVTLLVAVVTVLHFAAPSIFSRISNGQFNLVPLYLVYVPFLLLEFMVLWLVTRRLSMHSEVPTVRRYLSALIEISIPTFVLYQHMNWMGSAHALGFASTAGIFSVHRALDAAARFLAVHVYGICRRRAAFGDGDALSAAGIC